MRKKQNTYFNKHLILPKLVDGKPIDWDESWTYMSIFALTKTSTATLMKKSNLFIAAPMPF